MNADFTLGFNPMVVPDGNSRESEGCGGTASTNVAQQVGAEFQFG